MFRGSLSRKLCLIYSLNVVDWICTVILLRTGGYYEANPLMSPIIGDISAGFLIKCVFPAIILTMIFRLCLMLRNEDYPRVDQYISFALTLYTALCAVHILNFCLLYFD